MLILNVNSSLSLKTGGGTAERTFQMSRFLAMEGMDCTVLTVDSDLDPIRLAALGPAKAVAIQSLWKRFSVPVLDWRAINRLVHNADIVHLMGHWSALNAIVYFVLRSAQKPYVVCPAGALPIFGRSKVLKRLYNLVVGNNIIRNAAGWIAVTPSEFSHFESYGIHSSQVTVIPNGVSEEDFPPVDLKAFRQKAGLPDAPVILFMGRLNPIKGPDLLLRAFAMVESRIPSHHLVFAGPDEGMQSDLLDMARRDGLGDRVHFMGYVDGHQKSAVYRCARLLVVPSRQEAMSIVALEAGICGTPVLLTDQCGFGDIRQVDAGLEVQASVDGIADGLVKLLDAAGVLERIAPVWKDFVVKRYSWRAVVPRYIELYRDILSSHPHASIDAS